MNEHLSELNSHGTKLVYLTIELYEGISRRELSQMLDIPMLSLYKYLSTIEGENLVREYDGNYYPVTP